MNNFFAELEKEKLEANLLAATVSERVAAPVSEGTTGVAVPTAPPSVASQSQLTEDKLANFWENFILTTALGILAGLKKSPAQWPAFKTILTHALDDICLILGVTPPTVP